MKRKQILAGIAAGILAAVSLSGCGGAKEPEGTDVVLTFPKTSWGMTPQQVMKAYSLSAEDVVFSTAPQLFAGTEDDFYAAYSMKAEKDVKVLGEEAELTFYFADLVLADNPAAPLGLIYVEARFSDAALETHQKLEAELDALAERTDDPRTSWGSGVSLSGLETAEEARAYFEARKLDAETELAEPLVTIFSFSEVVEGQENYDDVIRWYGLNAALAAFLEKGEDPLLAMAETAE